METTFHATGARLLAIILQDHKRLPARFCAFHSGSVTSCGR
jgi:hypothetical protein